MDEQVRHRVSLKRVIRQIERHKRKILEHRDALTKLRADLEYIDAFVEGAHRSLQEAINDLSEIE
jgi:hypothetical protein